MMNNEYENFKRLYLTEAIHEEETGSLKVVAVNCSLKRKEHKEKSSTAVVLKELASKVSDDVQYFEMADLDIKVGTNDEFPDDMDQIYDALKTADVVLVGTPIWGGMPSSLVYKFFERLTFLHRRDQPHPMKNVIFGGCCTGDDDGHQAVKTALFNTPNWLQFLQPPLSFAFVMGEDKKDPKAIDEAVTPIGESIKDYAEKTRDWREKIEWPTARK
jgi:multimeric flavodoxin WrbA